ncbi:hypothetical protein [Hymenobacter sp. BRD67]|uniref:hypothetical protein n=1 Tax=Hymenobacter sp. BRD67 TaxID=2675877 RepID=UPI001563FB22|nr:hypothetical protein [Hymenobacter sp. BRD67]QKG51285.1 hypothetical protein GKZ67_00205 [Hymenobacter sp. BRD67]
MAKQHRGEVIREAVLKSGVKFSSLYRKLGISRPTLYRRFEDPNLDFDFIKRVGDIIYHNFAEEFKELVPATALEPIIPYQLDSLDDCKNKLLHVYSLYADMVQRYNNLLASREEA